MKNDTLGIPLKYLVINDIAMVIVGFVGMIVFLGFSKAVLITVFGLGLFWLAIDGERINNES